MMYFVCVCTFLMFLVLFQPSMCPSDGTPSVFTTQCLAERLLCFLWPLCCRIFSYFIHSAVTATILRHTFRIANKPHFSFFTTHPYSVWTMSYLIYKTYRRTETYGDKYRQITKIERTDTIFSLQKASWISSETLFTVNMLYNAWSSLKTHPD